MHLPEWNCYLCGRNTKKNDYDVGMGRYITCWSIDNNVNACGAEISVRISCVDGWSMHARPAVYKQLFIARPRGHSPLGNHGRCWYFPACYDVNLYVCNWCPTLKKWVTNSPRKQTDRETRPDKKKENWKKTIPYEWVLLFVFCLSPNNIHQSTSIPCTLHTILPTYLTT